MSKPPFIIVDGYNLLHTIGGKRSLGAPGNLQRARERLAGFIAARMDDEQRRRTTIVFDANEHARDLPESSNVMGITVLFARGHADADSLIDELLRKHSSPKSVIVVSNDREVRRSAARRRAESIDCEKWYESLENAAHRDSESLGDDENADRPESVDAAQLEEWKRLFGA